MDTEINNMKTRWYSVKEFHAGGEFRVCKIIRSLVSYSICEQQLAPHHERIIQLFDAKIYKTNTEGTSAFTLMKY